MASLATAYPVQEMHRAVGQPGWILKCKNWETDPNAYIYFVAQAPTWEDICKVIGKSEWITDPDYATPAARLPRLKSIFATVEEWTTTKSKFEATTILSAYDIPCGPILSMKEIAEDQSLRQSGTIVEVDHPTRGKYLTVGNPIKLSDSETVVERSPLLGEHTEKILRDFLKFDERRIRDIEASGRAWRTYSNRCRVIFLALGPAGSSSASLLSNRNTREKSKPRARDGMKAMTIVCNGTKREVESPVLSEILRELGYEQETIATAVNGRFVPVRQRGSVVLSAGDALEIVAPRQGG